MAETKRIEIDTTTEFEEAVTQLSRIAKILWATLVVAVSAAVGGAIWVTTVNLRIGIVEQNVVEIKTALVGDLMVRMREVEKAIAAGILPTSARLHQESDRKIDKVLERVRVLEGGRSATTTPTR